MYFSNYHTATELHEIIRQKASTPKQILDSRVLDSNAQDAYEKAIEYWQSVSQTSPPVNRGGELLIDAYVPPSAIVQYIE